MKKWEKDITDAVKRAQEAAYPSEVITALLKIVEELVAVNMSDKEDDQEGWE